MPGGGADVPGLVMKAKGCRGIALLALLMASSLSGCHDHAEDCLDADGPVFSTDHLPNGVLNEEYEARIRVQINNEPFDDLFFYDFDYEQGELPEGLRFVQYDAERYLYIQGTPTESGLFTLEVAVRVGGSPDLCYYRNRETYTLRVTEL